MSYLWKNRIIDTPAPGTWFNLDSGRMITRLDVNDCIHKRLRIVGSRSNFTRLFRENPSRAANDYEVVPIAQCYNYVCLERAAQIRSEAVPQDYMYRTLNFPEDVTIPELTLYGRLCKARVLRVVDGDTLLCAMKNPYSKFRWFKRSIVSIKIRIYGIDTPEVSTNSGRHAKEKMQRLVWKNGNRVWLLFDNREKYGRELALVFKDKECTSLLAAPMFKRSNEANVYLGGAKLPFK